jgi:hypothetical protein
MKWLCINRGNAMYNTLVCHLFISITVQSVVLNPQTHTQPQNYINRLFKEIMKYKIHKYISLAQPMAMINPKWRASLQNHLSFSKLQCNTGRKTRITSWNVLNHIVNNLQSLEWQMMNLFSFHLQWGSSVTLHRTSTTGPECTEMKHQDSGSFIPVIHLGGQAVQGIDTKW